MDDFGARISARAATAVVQSRVLVTKATAYLDIAVAILEELDEEPSKLQALRGIRATMKELQLSLAPPTVSDEAGSAPAWSESQTA